MLTHLQQTILKIGENHYSQEFSKNIFFLNWKNFTQLRYVYCLRTNSSGHCLLCCVACNLNQNQENNREEGEVFLHFQQHDKKPMIPVSVVWAMSLSRCCSTLTNSSVLRLPSPFASNKWKTISITLSERDKPQTCNWTIKTYQFIKDILRSWYIEIWNTLSKFITTTRWFQNQWWEYEGLKSKEKGIQKLELINCWFSNLGYTLHFK